MTGLVLCLLLAAGGVLLQRRPQDAVLPGDRSGRHGGHGAPRPGATNPDDVRGDAARRLLDRLAPTLEHGSTAQVAALAAPGDDPARRELVVLRQNVRRVGITGLRLRYVDETSHSSSGRGDSWVGDVQLSWRIAGFDRHHSRMQVSMAFRRGTADDASARAGFVTARRGGGNATPLWILGPVAVRRTPRALVIGAPQQATARFSRLADRAVVDVRKVLPGQRSRLVVEVPANQRDLTHVLGSSPGEYAGIAAVTTTTDGTLAAGTPVHIFVNPRVFDPLGPRGSQIVMSHEATHVALRAAFSHMPTWLLEGFADYVALAHVDLPVSVAASQILARVRRKGPPDHLPDAKDFDPRNTALGGTYESAWLACRLLGQRYGEKRLLAFYRAADRVSSTRGPFHTVLGTDQPAFTRAWRADLRRLAR